MRTIHITASYKPAYIYGGPIQSVGKLCVALSEIKEQGSKSKDHKIKEQGVKIKDKVEVLTTTANGKGELDVEIGKPLIVDDVQVTYFKRWTKDHTHFSPRLLIYLRNEILRCAQDDKLIIHIHAWWNLVSVFSCLIAKWYKIPVVLSPRGMLTGYSQHNRNSLAKKLIHFIVGKRLLKYCNIHATSEQEKREILRIVQPKSITVIPNLVNLKYQVASIKDQDKEPIFHLIFLSRIEEKKGLELLFDALSTIEIPWDLTIAGSGEESYLQRLKAKAERLKLSDRIYWVGQVSNECKFTMMSEHDLLVLTSYNENFANVVIESLSVGTSVLVSDEVGLADYVEEKELGWVCNLTIESIKDQLNLAYHSHDKREFIRDSAHEIIKGDFEDSVLVNRYIEMYEDVIMF